MDVLYYIGRVRHSMSLLPFISPGTTARRSFLKVLFRQAILLYQGAHGTIQNKDTLLYLFLSNE